jgi:hypothetical protein
MAVDNDVLFGLIKQNVDAEMALLRKNHHPISHPKNKYWVEMCKAFAYGIGQGTPLVNFVTDDVGVRGQPPVPVGTGAGIGIIVEPEPMYRAIYTYARNGFLAEFGRTGNIPYPPTTVGNGKWLLAICKGVALSVQTHFETVWTLTSTHTPIYRGTGTINDGEFSGISSSLVKSKIFENSPDFPPIKGWNILAGAVAQGYVDGIHQHSTGTVDITGVCVEAPPVQLCEVPDTGHGVGVAS